MATKRTVERPTGLRRILTNKPLLILVAILLLGSFLRLYGLSRGDVISDEALYGVRAIGMVDYFEGVQQTTPWEWFSPNIPWWTKLSFHDDPPLMFEAQHISMKLFGINTFGLRLPSALFGIAAILALYLVGKELYSREVGLAAAALLAITNSSLFISRIALLESAVIFFILITTYFFLRALKDPRFFWLMGVSLGLGLLTKYTVGIVVPIFATYLLLRRQELFKSKRLWGAFGVAILLMSPVLYYNFRMYQATGHFDLQFSYLFGQNPVIWQNLPGKETGTIWTKIASFGPGMWLLNSWLFLLLTVAAIGAFGGQLVRWGREALAEQLFLLVTFGWLLVLLLVIGVAGRFLTMLTPFMALAVGLLVIWFYHYLLPRRRVLCWIVLGVVALAEILYSYNGLIAYYPVGPMQLTWSRQRYETYNWGYNELDSYLNAQLAGKMPSGLLPVPYPFIANIQKQALAADVRRGLKPYPAIIIYDDNLDTDASFWMLESRVLYQGWTVFGLKEFLAYQQQDPTVLRDAHFKYAYFIEPANTVLQRDSNMRTIDGYNLEQQLLKSGLKPTIIRDPRGREAFRVYKF